MRAYIPTTMTEHTVPRGTYRHLEEPSDYKDLVDRYDNFLFGRFPV